MSGVEIKKSYEEINRKIREGKAVVVTAEEMPGIVATEGVEGAFRKVDVVTTGTFGAMCSSGAFINFGHTRPRMKATKVWLNNVEAYGGVAAVDCYIGATQVQENDPLNMVRPGTFKYGGGHVIEDLIARKRVKLRATGYGTDCYPLKEFETTVSIEELRDAIMFNPRNAYQNYNCAVNLSQKTIYTYMGILKPDMANAGYSSAGQLSPLLNDPYYWTIGTGTRIFLCGAAGSVAWHGTQHAPNSRRDPSGVPCEGAGTLAVIGDMKQMDPALRAGRLLHRVRLLAHDRHRHPHPDPEPRPGLFHRSCRSGPSLPGNRLRERLPGRHRQEARRGKLRGAEEREHGVHGQDDTDRAAFELPHGEKNSSGPERMDTGRLPPGRAPDAAPHGAPRERR